MFIKNKVSTSIRSSVEQYDKVRDLLKAIDDQFITSEKASASTLIMKFSSLRLISVKGVREHIMQMRDIAAQLKKIEVDMMVTFLVHFIMNTLLQQCGPFKISYNTHKDKWSINELMIMCVQEEERLVMELRESVILATVREKNKAGKPDKSQATTFRANHKGKVKVLPHSDIKKANKCFFCKKKGYEKKDCVKF